MGSNPGIVRAAIEYIEEHLNEKMDSETVAGTIHYSRYHLHRIFSDTVGLTIHEYILRRRLTEAAKLLVFSDRPIIDIAAGVLLFSPDTVKSIAGWDLRNRNC